MIKFKKLTIALLALLSISATAWADDGEKYTVQFKANGNTVTREVTLPHTFESRYKEFDEILRELYEANYTFVPESTMVASLAVSGNTEVKSEKKNGEYALTISAPFGGTATASGEYWSDANPNNSIKFNYSLEISIPGYVADPEVTITGTSAEGQQATFEMPAYDVTATYALKRDMAVDMPVTVQDAEQKSSFRVEEKQGGVFVPVGLTLQQVAALFNVHDGIEQKDLAATDYSVQIFAVDDNGDPTGNAMTFLTFTFAPGNYIAKAVAVDGSNYVGTTEQSNVFTLFQGYEVSVPAGEYITYYKGEALTVEDEDAQLYTITAVSGDKATATPLTVAAANMPILVKNNAEETKTILLIPTSDDADNVTAYSGFKGTLEAAQIAASDATQNNYAFNGQQFVWVKTAIAIGANKAWLEVPVSAGARAISIVFDSEATGITTTNYTNYTNGDWYDLNGRKLQAAPKRKGVYIQNGKKVVVK